MTIASQISGIASMCILIGFATIWLYLILSVIVEKTAKDIFKIIEGENE